MKNTLKSYSIYILLFVALTVCSTIETHAQVSKQDMKVIKTFANRNYKGYKISIKQAEKRQDRVILNRKGKHVLYIDEFTTKSYGKYGKVTTKGIYKGNVISYAKHHRKGKTVKVYLIYNPNSNYIDDLVASVECGKIDLNW